MSGSVPRPPKKAPRPTKRRRTNANALPWLLLVALFIAYAFSGLLLSAPTPPVWLWIPALIGTVLLVCGIHRPLQPDNKRDFVGITAYLGALLLVVSLAIAANYVGGGEAFDSARFFTALFLLAFLTSLAVVCTAAAAILSAQTGTQLLESMSYTSSLSVLLGTAFLGLFVGGLFGYLAVSAAA